MGMELRYVKTSAELALADVFAAARPSLPGCSAVAAARSAAFERFSTTGLPHRRVEAWRYTDLRMLMRDARPLAPPPDANAKARAGHAGLLPADLACWRLVVVDGRFAPDLSDLAALDAGVRVGAMAEALAQDDPSVTARLDRLAPGIDDPVLALNTALMSDGVVIRVAPGAAVTRPLHLVVVTTGDRPAAMITRSLVIVGAGARATLIETHEGPDGVPYQVNAAVELRIGDGASVERVKILREGDDALHLSTSMAVLGTGASLNDVSFVTRGAVVRNQAFVRLDGERASAALRGASLLATRQHVDTTLVVDHAAAGGDSRELFKSVLDGESRAVFQGRINVAPGAQRTDARMMTRALLLSDTAEADSKPELEIFADDIQCGHGSTTGALDEDLKFYLMARGIPAADAEALLIEAFVGEVTDAISHDGVRAALGEAVAAWLRERG